MNSDILSDSPSESKLAARMAWILFGLALLTVGAASIQDLSDLDVWWHLASGRWMVQHHQIVQVDPFSFTVYRRPWIDHEWLFQLLIYGAYSIKQIPAVLLFKAGLVILAAAGFLRCLPKSLGPAGKAILLLWVFYLCRFRNMARADIVSYALFSIFLAIYLEILLSQSRPNLWVLTGMMWLWINCHAGFLLIWGLTGVFMLAWAWQKRTSWRAPGQNPFLKLLLLYLGVSLLNPYGYHLLTSTFKTAFYLAGPDHHGFEEYLRTPYTSYEGYWITIIQAWVIWLIKTWQEKRVELIEGLCLVIGTWVGGVFIRNIPFALFLVVPVAARAGLTLITSTPYAQRAKRWNALAIAGIGLLAVVNLRSMGWGIQPNTYPQGAASFIQEHGHPGRGYNDYNFGGYLIWSLHERGFPVFIDGRMHAVEGYRDLWKVLYQARNYSPWTLKAWDAVLKHWDIDYAVMSLPRSRAYFQGRPISLFAYYFPKGQWALVFQDALSAVYMRRKDYDAQFIRTYEIKDAYPDVGSSQPVLNHAWKDFFIAG